MRIGAIRLFPGPNIYSYRPVVLVEAEDCLAVFRDAVTELAMRAGVVLRPVSPRISPRDVSENLLLEYECEAAARRILEVASDWLRTGATVPLKDCAADLKHELCNVEIGPSTRAIVDAAERRSIPWRRIDDRSLVQLGYGRNRRLIEAALTTNTSCIAVDIASNKQLTNSLLSAAGIPTPRGYQVNTPEEALRAMTTLRAPYVIKPPDGCQGRGVSLHLCTQEDVKTAFLLARTFSETVLIEEQLKGRDYRLLVINGVIQAASLRTPAHVIGDGVHTIEQLIEETNRNPLRGDGHECPLTKIHTDGMLLAVLTRNALTLDSVPAQGQCVTLRDSANLSTGGEAMDVTDEVHPEIRSMCERAARLVGLDICGIDLIAADVTQPLNQGGGIVEVNASPGLRMHLAPSSGQARDVGMAVVDSLYPRGRESRIPIVSITGTNGKTTVARMVSHVLKDSGQTVGMTTTDGIWIGGDCVIKGDSTSAQSAWTVLSDPAVEVAVLETGREGIVRRGLGYDWSDVAVITNIFADHFVQDGIHSMEGLFDVKSLVAERVRAGGTVVLNADDPLLATLPSHPRMAGVRRRIVFFTMDFKRGLLQRHLAEGNTAFFTRDGWIVEATGLAERWLVRVADIPATLGGAARHEIQNAMAATAACRAHGVSAKAITTSLKTFRPTLHNAGRGNLYQLGEAFVMVDYGRNAAAFQAMAAVAENWPAGRVIGVVGVPGDRSDESIRHAAQSAAAAFERIIIREDRDLRGRQPGEVARILQEEVARMGVESRVCLDTRQALSTAFQGLQPNDLVIAFYEDLHEVVEHLLSCGGQPATQLPWMTRNVLEPLFQPALHS